MKTKHTKGKMRILPKGATLVKDRGVIMKNFKDWLVEYSGDGCQVYPKGKRHVFNTVETDADNNIKELQSYANLIAAAPELYAALVAYNHAVDGRASFGPEFERAMELANAALAKAEGE